MKLPKHTSSILTGLALTLALAATAPSARANVYATNIKINGALTGSASVAQGAGATITYILNDAASLGVDVQILSGGTPIRDIPIATPNLGTLKGLNSVIWDGKENDLTTVAPPGNYTVQIVAQASGYGSWTQISNDSDAGQYAYYPWGMDVDRNTNSPYYGRVVVGSATSGSGTSQQDGLYKMNADGSVADEGWYGNANYLADDGGDGATAGQMPKSFGFNPQTIRIAEDDRIYWCDNSGPGAILSCDILATTYQVVIHDGVRGNIVGPNNYSTCPQESIIATGGWGIRQFDVCGVGTTNAAVYLVDTGDFPSWGVWTFRLTNAVPGQPVVSDPNDTTGARCIATGGADFAVTAAGIMVDYNLDVFVSQNRANAGDPLYRTFCYTNWNNGTLPAEGTGFGAEANVLGTPAWEVGSADDTFRTIWDTAIDSRSHPTLVAAAMDGGTGGGASKGIRVLSAADGSTVNANLDSANGYNGVAFDNVGNVYGCSRYNNKWRVWSPPGSNEATTPAVVGLTVTAPPTQPVITSISVSSGIVTIHFTGGASDLPTAFTLLSSSTVNPASSYTPAVGAIITGSAGSYTATVATSGGVEFYRIKR